MKQDEGLLDLAAAATRYSLSVSYFQKLIESGEITARRAGSENRGKWLIEPGELRRHFGKLRTNQQELAARREWLAGRKGAA